MKIITAFLLLFLTTHVYSQNFTVGIIGGISNTDVNGFDKLDDDEDFNRLGVVLGGFVNRSFNDRTSVQLEILYSTKGTYQPPDSIYNIYYRLRLNYLEVPILYKYKMHLIVNKEALDKLEIEGGPSFAFLTNLTQESNTIVLPFEVPFHKYDILFNLGLNYYFTENFSLDLRFANSIVPIRPNPGTAVNYFDRGEYNTTFSYTFRYIFR